MIISYTAPESVRKITNICNEKKCKGVFSWEIDDDNGMILEASLETLATRKSSHVGSAKKHVYAPDCESMSVTLKPEMVFAKGDVLYKSNAWASGCPGTSTETW